ncbi:MAG: universal stress protein, partial [Acidobacteriota bacterium]
MEISDILVPIDFSETSLKSLGYALSMVASDGEIYLLHVIDTTFVDKIDQYEISTAEAVTATLRQRAEQALDEIISQHSDAATKLNKMIVVGIPFVEILRIANDLDFSLIVMGIRGRQNPLKDLFFGSTVDKVLRATRIPVVCVP